MRKRVSSSHKQELLTAEILRLILSYDELTGIFVWLTGQRKGLVAGTRHGKYYSISIDSNKYLSHRLAWLYIHGEWPKEEIDHINSDCLDNRLSNLRCANRAQNNRNKGSYKNSKSGVKGVCLHKKTGKWFVQIKNDNRKIYLGLYSTIEEAANAYAEAANNLHKEFARIA
jgi:hypothetical protein